MSRKPHETDMARSARLSPPGGPAATTGVTCPSRTVTRSSTKAQVRDLGLVVLCGDQRPRAGFAPESLPAAFFAASAAAFSKDCRAGDQRAAATRRNRSAPWRSEISRPAG
ncbi:hypothetical protein [Streptomyces glomeratus]|uniref:hypothetical protein n=1 Tax=Streptomyces glomeratus TaxID=284452 RepID=UPI001F1F4E7C|nr:hypothetical protein [Streptomyces glomeratus]MCF1506646.1 hypothetical protein [Streptomyces glomeratus]